MIREAMLWVLVGTGVVSLAIAATIIIVGYRRLAAVGINIWKRP